MRFDLKTHETLILLAGFLGLLEQELVRVFLDIEPNSLMAGAFLSMILGQTLAAVARNVLSNKRDNDGDSN